MDEVLFATVDVLYQRPSSQLFQHTVYLQRTLPQLVETARHLGKTRKYIEETVEPLGESVLDGLHPLCQTATASFEATVNMLDEALKGWEEALVSLAEREKQDATATQTRPVAPSPLTDVVLKGNKRKGAELAKNLEHASALIRDYQRSNNGAQSIEEAMDSNKEAQLDSFFDSEKSSDNLGQAAELCEEE